MSAEVILMNKNGIAIAADSAVTVGNKTKIYNTADKMFMLSKYAPVGILIYNSSSIMGVQVELIIKEYRKKLGEKTFETLQEYFDDFIKYCINFSKEYSVGKIELEFLNKKVFIKFDEILKITLSITNKEVGRNSFKNDTELMNFVNEKVKEVANKIINDNVQNDGVIDDAYYKKMSEQLDINNIIDFCSNEYRINLQNDTKLILSEKLKKVIQNIEHWDSSDYTGIAITGYGEKQIFPSCIQSEIVGIINNNIVEKNRNFYKVTHDCNAQIIPLAQTDVMNEFFLGFNNEIEINNERIITERIKKEENQEIKDKINELRNTMSQEKNNIVDRRRKNIFQSLSFLPRDEMIYMAEGMINLTSFKRRLVLDNYSETVGGPIDLAYISKGDGFVWIKRKKYFDREMNYVFTQNYFKKKGE